MKTLLKITHFIFFVCIINFPLQAQHSYATKNTTAQSSPILQNNKQTQQKVKFTFKMDYSESKQYFTQEDAQKLQFLLAYSSCFLSCDPEQQIVLSKSLDTEIVQPVNIVDKLQQFGYQLKQLQYKQIDSEVIFTLYKDTTPSSSQLKEQIVDTPTSTEFLEISALSDCAVCEEHPEISKDLLIKFEGVDYGGELIFDSFENFDGHSSEPASTD